MSGSQRQPSHHQCEKQIQCLSQQVQEYHRQIGQVTEELDSTRNRLSTSCREFDDLKKCLNQRDDTIICLEGKLENLRFDLKEKEREFQRQTGCFQEQIGSLTEQLHQKDSALTVCQKEVKNHLSNMEELKTTFCYDLQQKDVLLMQLRENTQNAYCELKCKSEDNCKLSRELVDVKSKLSQTADNCGQAESKVAFLEEKIPQLESQFCKEKQMAVDEIEEFEKRLGQAHSELCCATGEVRKMKRILQEKEDELDQVCCEKESLCRDLQREKDEARTICERAETLESDNKEICRLLQLKIKNLKEVEQVLCIREQELGQCRACVEELNAKIRKFNVSTGPPEDMDENKLEEVIAALRKCEAEKAELEKKLQYAVAEMEKLAKEVRRLKCELEESKNDNCDKDMLIGDLKQSLEHAKHDMEMRMRRVDQQLEKYEKEIKDKTTMLVEAEDKSCRLQGAVNNKNMEIEDLDQKLSNACCEVNSLRSQLQELNDTKQCLQLQFNEERARNAELTQDNKMNKDRLQMLCNEVANLKRDLASSRKDLEIRCSELEDLKQIVQDRECKVHQVTEDNTYLSSKLSSMQCRLEEETNQLTHKLSETKCRLESEVEKLRRRVCEVETNNSQLCQKMSSKDRQVSQIEKGCFQKVDALSRENSILQGKLDDKEFQLQATREGMTIKEAEIMRLRLRLCSIHRCGNSQEGSACKGVDPKTTANALACLDSPSNGCGGCGSKKRSQSCDGGRGYCS